MENIIPSVELITLTILHELGLVLFTLSVIFILITLFTNIIPELWRKSKVL